MPPSQEGLDIRLGRSVLKIRVDPLQASPPAPAATAIVDSGEGDSGGNDVDDHCCVEGHGPDYAAGGGAATQTTRAMLDHEREGGLRRCAVEWKRTPPEEGEGKNGSAQAGDAWGSTAQEGVEDADYVVVTLPVQPAVHASVGPGESDGWSEWRCGPSLEPKDTTFGSSGGPPAALRCGLPVLM